MRISLIRRGNGFVADFTLTAKPVLGGLDKTWAGARLTELTGLAAVAVSVPLGQEEVFRAAVEGAFGALPEAGASHLSPDGARVVWFAAGQYLILWDHPPHGGVPAIEARLGTAGYYVEQTSNWVFLALEGARSRAALERLTALDLADASFPLHRAERTVMEHMGALVIRTGQDGFLLASASSTGRSFAHALETSLDWVN